MNIWQVLEIEPTGEVKEIKRAYAKKLKKTNPEDDPEGFQVLKEAYDSCLRYAKNYKKNIEYNDLSVRNEELDIVHSEEEFNENDNGDIYKESDNQRFIDLKITNNEDSLDDYNYKTPPRINIKEEEVNLEVNFTEQIELFFEKVQALYDDFFKRIDLKYWEELLNDEVMWKFELKNQIGTRMADFLIENYCLPRDVFKLVSQSFQINEEKWHTHYDYPREIVNYIFLQLSNEDRITRYNYLDENANVDFGKYVKYREDAFIELMNNELGNARKFIVLAEEIYDKDPYLKCMNSEYYIRINDDITGDDNFNVAIELSKDDIAIYLYQAKTFTYANKIDKATAVYKFLVSRNPKDLGLRELLGKRYIDNSDFVNASKVFRESLKIEPEDRVARDYLTRILHFVKDEKNSKIIRSDLKKECKNIVKDLKAKSTKVKSGKKSKFVLFLQRNFGYFALLAGIINAISVIGKNASSSSSGDIALLLILAGVMYLCFKYFKKAGSRDIQGKKRFFYIFLDIVVAIVALIDFLFLIVGVLELAGLIGKSESSFSSGDIIVLLILAGGMYLCFKYFKKARSRNIQGKKRFFYIFLNIVVAIVALIDFLFLIVCVFDLMGLNVKDGSSSSGGVIIILLVSAGIMYLCFKYFKKARSRNIQGKKDSFIYF
ncbi:hypothetical protein CFOLD11_11990 [Clostridium folliculivorans]|uniref:J domain-containing protein n=1 Tax=Clostridium folliculivorans TaxID=2886038 RepID=A0A9W5Y0H2_9CLOT|nr:hypothetical protein [Clostridium folliculivorans]GKU24373.1 hypothetical protein CFOLD11_11990 [Clostridium folliculivorans]